MSGYTVFTCTKHTIYTCVFIYIYRDLCVYIWLMSTCVMRQTQTQTHNSTYRPKNFKVDGLYHIDAPTKHHVTGRTPPASTALGQLQCSCMRVGQRGIMGHEKGGGGRAQRFISCEAIYIKHAGQLLACTSCVTPIPRPINYPSKPSWTCWCTHSIPLGDLTNAMINAPCIPPI